MSQEPCTLFWPRSGLTPTPSPPEIAGRHGEIRHAHHHGRTLAVLGDAQAVIDRGIRRPSHTAARRRATSAAGTPVIFSMRFGRILSVGRRTCATPRIRSRRSALDMNFWFTKPSVTITCASALIIATLVPGLQRQMIRRLDMGRAHQVDLARIDDDQFRAFPQAPLHARREHRMRIGRIGADHHHDVGIRPPNRNPAFRRRCRTSS